MKHAVFISLVVVVQVLSTSLKLSLDSDLLLGRNDLGVSLNLSLNGMEIVSGIVLSNDERYTDPITGRFYFGYHYDFDEESMRFELGNLKLKIGRFHVRDFVESPYSLFITSEDLKTTSLKVSYEDERFSFTDVWIGLTREVHTDGLDFPSRGMNFKTLAIKLGRLRLGYQESAVYTGRFFDVEYFSNPVPNFYTQYILYVGRPFRQGTNDNSILGFFLDWKDENLYAYSQILIDDFNMNRFYGGFQNPDKLAWSLGTRFEVGKDVLEIYHAGATKYTFESVSPENPYGYVLYPTVVAPVGDSTRVFLPEENYVGYKYGENNVAFLMRWSRDLGWGILEIGFEYVLSGAVSPVNPWHDLESVPEGTHILDDDVLRRSVDLESGISFKPLPWVRIRLGMDYLKIANDFEVVNPEDGDGYYLVPRPAENREIFGFNVGVSVHVEW